MIPPVDHDSLAALERRLQPQAAQRIERSLSELHRVVESIVRNFETGPGGERNVPDVARTAYLRASEGTSGRDVAVVMSADDMKAVTLTERRDDRYDLDLNLFLGGLDEYEVSTVKRLLTQHLRSLIAAARQANCEERITQLIRAVAPPDPLADMELRAAESTATLRREFLEEVPVLTSAEVHANAGFPGSNPSQTVHRWRKAGKIFAVNHGGRDLYPAFQFGVDGRPLPIIAELLAILRRDSERTDWDNALWFVGESGWLNGHTPLDCLQTSPEAVKRAAEQEVLRDES